MALLRRRFAFAMSFCGFYSQLVARNSLTWRSLPEQTLQDGEEGEGAVSECFCFFLVIAFYHRPYVKT